MSDKLYGLRRLREEYNLRPKPDAKPKDFYKDWPLYDPDDCEEIPEGELEGEALHTKGVLKEMGLRPKKGAPVQFNGKYNLYKVADCVKIQKKPRTPAQVRGSTIAGLKARLRSKHGEASLVAQDVLKSCVILDVETTGLSHRTDQIIEIGIVNHRGEVLMDQRVRPTVDINPEAEEIHGITIADLNDCPAWNEIVQQVMTLLASEAVVVAFNAEFEQEMLYSSSRAYEIAMPWRDLGWCCAMYMAVEAFGATNRYGGISLSNACYAAGVSREGAHTAVGDCLSTLRMIESVAQYSAKLQAELDELMECVID